MTELLESALGLLKKAGNGIMEIAKKSFSSKAGIWIKSGIVKFGKNMLKNISTKKWWEKAVRRARGRLKGFGSLGKIGNLLNSSGNGVLGMFGKGLSVFDADFRTPKEVRSDIKSKEASIRRLTSQKNKILEKQVQVQSELATPISIPKNITDSEKIDSLAEQLSSMKLAIGKTQANSEVTDQRIKLLSNNQQQANLALADAIDYGTQTNMKTTIEAANSSDDVTREVVATSAESIVGQISSQIQAIEQRRIEEEEFRRKNNWKVKLLKSILWLADWALNWERKLIVMAIKLGVVILSGITALVIKYITPIKALISAGFKVMGAFIGLKITSILLKIESVITKALGWVVKKILESFFDKINRLIGLFENLPFVGKYIKAAKDYIKKGEQGIIGGIDAASKFISDGSKAASEKLNSWASDILKGSEALYAAKAKKEESPNKISKKVKSSMDKSSFTDSANNFMSGDGEIGSQDDKALNLSDANSSKDSKSEKVQDKQNEKTKVSPTATNKLSKSSPKSDITKDNTSISEKNNKTTVKFEVNNTKEKLIESTKGSSDKIMKELKSTKEEIKGLKSATVEGLAGKGSGEDGKPVILTKKVSVNFKASQEQHENLKQMS